MDKNANNKNNTTSTDEVTISRAQYEEFLKVKAEKIALEQDKT